MRAFRTLLLMAMVGTLCVSACGSATGPSPSPAAPTDPEGASPAAPVVFFRDGAITDEALSRVVVDGEVDAALLADFQAAFAQLPPTDQANELQALSARYELESARASGLADAIGGEGAAVPAIAGAWGPVGSAVKALDPSSLQLEDATRPSGSRSDEPVAATAGASGRLAAYVPVVPSRASGLAAADPGASAATVGVVGIFLAETALAVLADTVISAANGFESADTYKEDKAGPGTVISGAVEQSTLEMDYDGQQEGVDVKFHTELVAHPCPDPTGTFDASAKVEIATSKGSAGARTTLEMVIHGQVDDDAKLVGTEIETRMQTSEFGGQKGQFVDFTMTGGSGREAGFKVNRTGGTPTSDMFRLAVFVASMFQAMTSDKLVAGAEKAWTSGRCVRLDATATPGPKAVKPGSMSTIVAPPRSRIDGAAVGGSVTAQLKAGGATVNPSATKVAADATFTYTAPNEAGKSGTVTLEARSKRGVGKATLDFTTAIAPTVIITGTVPYTFGSGSMKGTATIDLTMTPSPDGSYTGTAQVRMTGQLKSPGTTCTPATWREAIELGGVLTSEDDQQVLVISTTGSAPTGASRPMKCTTAGVTINSATTLLTSTLFGEVHLRLADGDQAFLVSSAAGKASGTVSVRLR